MIMQTEYSRLQMMDFRWVTKFNKSESRSRVGSGETITRAARLHMQQVTPPR